jgi:hypothetical protein
MACLLIGGRANAQQRDAPKIEIGGQFTTFERREPTEFGTFSTNQTGVGGRFSYNVTDYFGLEGEVNVFPQRSFHGRMTQGQFGIKAGKRFQKFGVFAKARPGFVSLSEVFTPAGTTTFTRFDGQQVTFTNFENRRRTLLSMDVGGALEVYPSRNLLVRVDAGDTLIRYHGKETVLSNGGVFRDLPAGVVHSFQLTTGVAYRFLNPKGADEADPPPPQGGIPRYEVGIQYTTLVLSRPQRINNGSMPTVLPPSPDVLPAIGGRFTFNLNDHVALEGAVDFLTRVPFIGGTTFGSHGFQGQFGIKAGRRFKRFGLFGKVRPGFLRFSDVVRLLGTQVETRVIPGESIVVGIFGRGPKTYFETDVGGVVEFYPTRRVVTRFDMGDTMIWYHGRVGSTFSLRQSIFRPPDEMRHNFQLSAGVGFRF